MAARYIAKHAVVPISTLVACDSLCVKHSEFRDSVEAAFGPVLGPALVREQVLPTLGNRTAETALAAGVEPRDVWHHLCDTLDATPEQRWGAPGMRGVPLRSR